MNPSISVVVPVYNSEHSLRELVSRLRDVLTRETSDFEVILVNDASQDGSWEICRELTRSDPAIRCFDLMRNYGQHNAVLCGVRAAHGEIIVTIDDDLQHPPEEIPALLAEMRRGFDVVYGAPVAEQHGLWRDLASQVTKLVLQNALGAETARQVGGFRAFRTSLREGFAHYDGWWVNIDVLLTWSTVRFSAVRVPHRPRVYGKSNYDFKKLVTHALNMLTGFSALPLHVASFLGFFATFVGLLLLCYVWGRYFIQGVSVPGFAFLASIIVLFAGAQLFTLGILGEYLGRIHFRSMTRPSYVVRTETRTAEAVEAAIHRPPPSH